MKQFFVYVAAGLTAAFSFTNHVNCQPPTNNQPVAGSRDRKPGVSVNDAKAFKGYTLIAPMNSTKAHLIDMDGRVVHTWECDATPALSTYLLDNGHLLRPASKSKGVAGPGAGGRIQEFDWDGKLVWDYQFEGQNQHPHHDIRLLPNGNVLMIVGERKTKEEAIAAGRRPETAQSGIEADAIFEVQRTGPTTGEIIWEWHIWDHLVQELDKDKANYGKASANPGRIDINYGQGMFGMKGPSKDDLDKLKGIGYLGGPGATGKFNPGADWTHINSVAYNADLDQIMVSVHGFSELWIIDHSTTTKEAAGKTGGKHGKGGDLLYRWGNPQAYRTGSNADQRLFHQHDAQWIPKGLPGAGNILVFNNGGRRPDGSYSSVDEIVPPISNTGSYERKPGVAFGPSKAAWSYAAPNKSDFFAMNISGAHRLPNGNTFICSGPDGTVFEVTSEKDIVWKFVNPKKDGFGPGGRFTFGAARPGEVISKRIQDQLNLTSEQEKQLAQLQKDVDDRLEKLLTEEQREQIKKLRDGPGFGGFPFGGKDRGDDKGPGVGPMGGGPGPGGLFRSYRYGIDHPAFKDRTLTPGKKIEEL